MIQYLLEHPPVLYAVTFVLGAFVGSFLNVLAIRSLSESSIFRAPSSCPKCQRRLNVIDLIPIVSYISLKGRCRHCRARIPWYYLAVEIFTAVSFVVIVKTFGITLDTAGMLYFASVLIAICITDFKEKLIPHEITYPSIVLGLIFSAYVRNDITGAMVGVGASYILFDFLAFYGLKLYLRQHPELAEKDDTRRTQRHIAYARRAFKRRSSSRRPSGLRLKRFVLRGNKEAEEEIEVMGGGDAVLSALISAWLGWQSLLLALFIGFLAGCILGAIYLMVAMQKAGILKRSLRWGLIGFIAAFSVVYGLLLLISHTTGIPTLPSWTVLSVFAGVCAGLLGIILKGRSVSKPFPFGPALAFGAALAIFYVPMPEWSLTTNSADPLEKETTTRLWQKERARGSFPIQ